MLARGLRNVDGEMDVDRVGYVAGFVLFDTRRIQYLWAPLEEAEQWRGESCPTRSSSEEIRTVSMFTALPFLENYLVSTSCL
jgi:hypothetical protein